MTSVHDFSAVTLDGHEVKLSDHAGRVLLVVNIASRCGFTPQYTGLEALYGSLGPEKFAILGFPCNQFGAQEPGDAAEIARFCSTSYQVTFPLFAKIEVNGAGAHPLYKYLKTQQKGLLGTEAIKWNFTKFLVDQTGRVVERYGSNTRPEEIRRPIEALLKRQ